MKKITIGISLCEMFEELQTANFQAENLEEAKNLYEKACVLEVVAEQ